MKPFIPEIIEMPAQRVATVTSKGDPNTAAQDALGALYGSVYTLKFDLKKRGLETFKVTGLKARWPDINLTSKDQWTGNWALWIPQDTEILPQKSPDFTVCIDTWEYGTVAQVLYLGPYSEEKPTIDTLLKFIEDNGYRIIGDHEEEYLTRPTAKVPKTIIRYRITR